MSWVRFLRRRKWDEERARELESYLQAETEENVARGMSAEEASRAAHVKLGNTRRIREEIYEMNSIGWLETLWQDVHYGLRMLRRNPGFTIVAVLTLALGIGANTAIFSVVDAVLLKPLRYTNPSALVIVWGRLPTHDLWRNVVSPPDFFDWQAENRVFSGMAAFVDQPLNLTGAGEPEQVSVEQTSPNFFSVLGVNPMLGRAFTDDADQPGKNDVAVLSYGMWTSKFGGDTDIIGKKIELNGKATTVIGVAGPDFDWYIKDFSFTHRRPQLWMPLALPPAAHDRSKSGRYLRVVARLKQGVTLPQAQSQMSVVAAGLAAQHPDYDKGWDVNIVSLRDQLSGALRPALLILLGAVGLVLLIACANLSSLLLARAAGRRREIAIRAAIGASRWRIARQLLTESILLSVIGGALGVVVAMWATGALVHAGSTNLPDAGAIGIDWRVVAFAAGVTALAGLAAGCLPSLISSHGAIATALPEGGRNSSAGRRGNAARSALVVVEIGMALVLLTGSALLIQSFYRLMAVNPGFRVAHLLTFRVALPDSKYATAISRGAFFSDLLGRIRQLPGVSEASADSAPPFGGVGAATGFVIVGEPPLPVSQQHGTDVRVIEPDYFRTMGIPLRSGRLFTEREFTGETHVVIVNQLLVNKYFHGANPLGQRLIIDMKDTNVPCEIVGVVGDVREDGLSESVQPVAYWPFPELPYSAMAIVVRSAGEPLALMPSIRAAVRDLDKDQPIAEVNSMEQLVAKSVADSRFTMVLLAAFAALALVLACVGIYGVMAYSVSQRTHEIGIRVALGAQRNDVLRLVLGQGTRLALAGVGIGIIAALALTRLMASLLYQVSATDPLTFVAVIALLIAVALAACYIPARRAMRVDPMVALRYE
ncbi:MAG: ADOP family duplicated permease [Candidatus Acidiferrales bacterium]